MKIATEKYIPYGEKELDLNFIYTFYKEIPDIIFDDSLGPEIQNYILNDFCNNIDKQNHKNEEYLLNINNQKKLKELNGKNY